jgi:hypothetical protein
MTSPAPSQSPANLVDEVRYLAGQLAGTTDARLGRPHAHCETCPLWYQVGYDRAWLEETQKRRSIGAYLS